MISNYNLEVLQGESYSLSVNAADAYGAPIDLTNRTIRSYIRTTYGNTSGYYPFVPAVTNATGGAVDLVLSATVTAALPIGRHVYDVEAATSGDASVIKFLKGYINIHPEATY